MKGIDLLRKLQSLLPLTSLLTIYKSFIRPHLDYGDVVYDQLSNDAFSNKPKTVQYNAALAITGTTKGTSREKSGLIRVQISSKKKMNETSFLTLQSCFKRATS